MKLKMFKYNYYIPILKAKRGEFRALTNLSEKAKLRITPLIDVPPAKGTLEKHLKKVANNIILSWKSNRPFFLDIFGIKPTARTSKGLHPLTYIFQLLHKSLLSLPIPTTGLDRDNDHNNAVANIIVKDKRGVCIRLLDEDMINIRELNVELDELLKKLKIHQKKVDLIMDFRSINIEGVDELASKVTNIINRLSNVSEWRTLTLAASSFPENLSEVKRDSITKLPRAELTLWKFIIGNSKKLKRVPSYGDYGIVHPNHLILDPRTINPSAKIRYTLDEEWLVLKGQSLKKHSKQYKQYHDLSQGLVDRDEFMGASFSKGDEYIAKCADGNVSSGNLETWVRVDTIHHLTLVSDQIANTVAI